MSTSSLLADLIHRAADRLERAEGLDRVAGPVHATVMRVAKPGRLRDVLSGTGLGHPVHPMMVAGPIGCWSAALVLDLTGQRRAARTLTGTGVLAALPTALTGLSDWADTTGAEQRVGMAHLTATATATSAQAASWLMRKRGRYGAGVALAVTGAGLTAIAGWLGGHLAYALGVGVDTNAFSGGPVEWSPAAGTVPDDGSPVAIEVEGVSLLAVRVGEGLRVIANRCSHRGAPLSDGDIGDGCVTCPWHGSRFDLTTGAVRRGPATLPQATYQVREVGQHLEVRREEPRSLRTNSTRAGRTD